MTLQGRRERWVNELKSGDYDQDQSYLKTDDGYCCLGVLCDIEGIEWSEDTKINERGYIIEGTAKGDNAGETEGLTVELLNKYQLNGVQGQLNDTIYWIEGEWEREVPSEQYSYSSYDSLAEANDDGRTFDEIAALITDDPELVWAEVEEKATDNAVINTAS